MRWSGDCWSRDSRHGRGALNVPLAMTVLVRAATLMFLLGGTVVVWWTLVGVLAGASAWRGGGNFILSGHGSLLYGLLAASAALVLFALVRRRWRDESIVRLATIVCLAWIGEGICLTLIGPLRAAELRPPLVWFMWLAATGFGLQPAAAFLGGLVALRSISTHEAAGP